MTKIKQAKSKPCKDSLIDFMENIHLLINAFNFL